MLKYTGATNAGYPGVRVRWQSVNSGGSGNVTGFGVRIIGNELKNETWPINDPPGGAVTATWYLEFRIPEGPIENFLLQINEVGDTANPGDVTVFAATGVPSSS